jgi:hypothetical protein
MKLGESYLLGATPVGLPLCFLKQNQQILGFLPIFLVRNRISRNNPFLMEKALSGSRDLPKSLGQVDG